MNLYNIQRCKYREPKRIVEGEPPLEFKAAQRRAQELQDQDPVNKDKTSSWGMALYFPKLIGKYQFEPRK